MSTIEKLKSPQARTVILVLLACLGALASRYAVPFAFRYSVSFLPLAVAVLLFFLYRTRLSRVLGASRASKRLAITCAITALLFSSFLVIGSWGVSEDAGAFGILHGIAIIVNALPLYVLLVMLMTWLDQTPRRKDSQRSNPAQLTFKGSLIVFAVLLICWLPMFLAAYPGFFCYDMTGWDGAEWTQYSSGSLTQDTPVAHTLILGAVLSTMQNITGSLDAGVTVFVALQALIASAIFTFMLHHIYRSTHSLLIFFASLAFLALNPLVSMFVMCTTRDTLFSAFVVLLATLLFVLFARMRGTKIGSGESEASSHPSGLWGLLISVGLATLAVCLLRPNGIYAVIVTAPFAILCAHGWKMRLRVSGVLAGALVLFALFTGPVCVALGVSPANIPARLYMLSIPAQQITYTVENNNLRLTELQMLRDTGFGGTDENGNMSYVTHQDELADGTRWNLQHMSDADVLKVYLTLGASYPQEYLKALVAQTQAAWNPYAYGRAYKTGDYEDRETALFAFKWDEPVQHRAVTPPLSDAVEAISTSLALQNVPLLSLLVSIPFYLWVLLLMLCRAIVARKWEALVPGVLLAALTLTALFGPCVLVRYYLYLIFALPLMAALLFRRNSRSQVA